MMGKPLVPVFLVLGVQIMTMVIFVHSLPPRAERRYNLNYLNSTSSLGTMSNTQSNASATGPGSSVEISGIVSGETSASQEAQSSLAEPGTSSISSQADCSEYSTSSATGGLSADALASGDCITNIDDTGSHHFQDKKADVPAIPGMDKVAFGMEGQVNSHGQQGEKPEAPLEATITQATVQNSADGSAEAYQMVSGPQATSAFSGMMAQAQGDIVHGTQETLMTHASGDTSIQSLVMPFPSSQKTKMFVTSKVGLDGTQTFLILPKN